MSNGARTIVVESPDRFARDLMVQLAGHDMLKAKGIALIAASAPTFFLELKRMWFNADTTAHGIEALRQYRTAYDEKTKAFSDTPHRDWTTDIADAARYMAIAAREIAPPPPPKSERPAGISMDQLTMDEFLDLEDLPTRRDRV